MTAAALHADAPLAGFPASNAGGPPPVAAFLDLEEDFRKARDIESLRMALVTGARKLAAYECALFLECDPTLTRALTKGPGRLWRVTAASGASSVDRHAPFLQAFEKLIADLASESAAELEDAQDFVLDGDDLDADLVAHTNAFPHVLWAPVRRPDGRLIGALAVFSRAAWGPAQATLLAALAGPFGHAYGALADRAFDLPGRVAAWRGKARVGLGALAAVLLVLAFPVRFSTLAPAEVVGAQPTLISAPMDGVVRDIVVEPGDQIAAGTPLFTLVDTKLRNDFEVAEKARAVALAKYQRAVQNAVTNRRDSQDIAVAKADLEVAEAELALAQDLFARTQIVAPRAGVIVYSSKSDWLGKPVTTGERVMDIVDPADLELRVDLGVSDAIALKTGMRAKLFLDGDPLSAVGAEISRIGYRPVPNAERQMVYRVFADFTDGGSPRLGARGTARIDADRVPLGFYLFRRPLAALRQKIGL
jgi:multidrug efflux pump subunit AcrA (membrane-fusion protein)